jgi:hypothetical protein
MPASIVSASMGLEPGYGLERVCQRRVWKPIGIKLTGFDRNPK